MQSILSTLSSRERKKLIDELTDDFLELNEIRVSYDKLPHHVDAISFPVDTWYHIVVNINISADRQKAAALHELVHISNNDFDRIDPVEIIEKENLY